MHEHRGKLKSKITAGAAAAGGTAEEHRGWEALFSPTPTQLRPASARGRTHNTKPKRRRNRFKREIELSDVVGVFELIIGLNL